MNGSSQYFLVYIATYDDPCPLVGPFPTYDAALDHYRASLVAAGAGITDDETAAELYLGDDAVLIGKT